MRRREFLQTGVVAGAAALASDAVAQRAPIAAGAAGRLKQSVCKWCFPNLSLDALAAAGKNMGLRSIELLGPDEWPTLKKHGLVCALSAAAGPGGIPRGFNRVENHAWLIPAYEQRLRQAAEAGVPSVICFSGNREGLSDAQGLDNCARGLARLAPLAQRLGVNLIMELLNSKVDHRDYMCDHTSWGVALVQKVGSERFKLLYDIYHMQIMEGDVIRTIRDNHQHIGHYHTAGVPGRHELDETQELFYPPIMRAIADTGFAGYVAQEFVPTRDPLASLAQAVRLCDV